MSSQAAVVPATSGSRRPSLHELIRNVLQRHDAYRPKLHMDLCRTVVEDEVCMTELWSRIDRENRALRKENALLQGTIDGLADELLDCLEGDAGG